MGQVQRGQGDGRGGVAAHRLQVGGSGGVACRLQLLAHQEAVLLIRDDDGRCHWQPGAGGQRRCALDGGLQHGVLARQGQQLLGVGRTRQGPQAGAGSAAQDDGVEGVWRCGCHGAGVSGGC